MDETTCSTHRAARFVLAVALALVGGIGCRQVLGVDAFRVEPAGADSGSPTGNVVAPTTVEFRAPRCTACMKEQCQAELSACLAEPTCRDFWTCRAVCPSGDAHCENVCRSRAWPWNGGAYRVDRTGELESCLASRCDDTCDELHVLGTDDCTACAHSECTDVDWKAHAASVDAQHLESCDARCVAITQSDERRLAYCGCEAETGASDDAVALWKARRSCTTTTCSAQCNLPATAPDLDCLGTHTVVASLPDPIGYRLVAYGLSSEPVVEAANARACALSESPCENPRAGPKDLTFLLEKHATVPAGMDFAGSAALELNFGSTFEPFADHMEVRIGGYRNLLYQVPRLQQDELTVWWPVASLDDLVAKLKQFKPGITASNGSFLVVIVADCEGRALGGVKVSADFSAEGGGDVRSLEPSYILSDGDHGTLADIGVAFFTDVPPGTVKVTATYDGKFHGSGQVLVVPDGSTLIGLGPSAPQGETR